MSWTDERVEQLRTMWIEGRSASQIAKALGGVTRNAVIGKVHRLGLSNRAGGKPGEAEEAVAAVAAPATPEVEAEENAAPPLAPEAAAPAAAAEAAPEAEAEALEDDASEGDEAVVAFVPAHGAPGPQILPAVSEVSDEARRNLEAVEKKARRLNLLQLTERTCKWPIGDPATENFYFCGLPALSGKPYCEAHVAVAFQPMSARRDRARVR